MAAPLHLEMAEAHIAQDFDFRHVQGQYALVLIGQQGVEAAAAVVCLPGLKFAVIKAHEVERRFGKGVIMQRTDGAVADAVLVDQQNVALLVLNLLQQVIVQYIIRVHHDLIILIGQAFVYIQLAFAAFGNFENGGNDLQGGVFLADVLAQEVVCQDDGVLAGRIVTAEEDAERVTERILQVFFGEQQVGEGEVNSNVAVLVFQTSGAHFLGIAHQVLEYAAGIPLAERRAVHDVEDFESEQELAIIVECNQLTVVDKRA